MGDPQALLPVPLDIDVAAADFAAHDLAIGIGHDFEGIEEVLKLVDRYVKAVEPHPGVDDDPVVLDAVLQIRGVRSNTEFPAWTEPRAAFNAFALWSGDPGV